MREVIISNYYCTQLSLFEVIRTGWNIQMATFSDCDFRIRCEPMVSMDMESFFMITMCLLILAGITWGIYMVSRKILRPLGVKMRKKIRIWRIIHLSWRTPPCSPPTWCWWLVFLFINLYNLDSLPSTIESDERETSQKYRYPNIWTCMKDFFWEEHRDSSNEWEGKSIERRYVWLIRIMTKEWEKIWLRKIHRSPEEKSDTKCEYLND